MNIKKNKTLDIIVALVNTLVNFIKKYFRRNNYELYNFPNIRKIIKIGELEILITNNIPIILHKKLPKKIYKG